jgi:putative transposase
MRVTRSRELGAQGRPAAVVARVAGISRQAIYRRPKRPPAGQRRPPSATDRVVLEVAHANPTDGTRMVAALAGRELGGQVNRKRVQRLMREHALLQRHRSEGRRRRPGFFRVERPDQLWHLDMTSVWVAEHGWCYLNAAIDCCTREIVGWALDIRCRAHEAAAVIDAAVAERGINAGELTLGTDNGTAFTSRMFRARLREHEITHRRGGYRDPPRMVSRIVAAATVTPRARRSSSPGSASSSSAASGARSSRPSTRPAPALAPTSTATTTGPTKGWPTARRAKSRRPGKITTTSQSRRPDRQHRRGPRQLRREAVELLPAGATPRGSCLRASGSSSRRSGTGGGRTRSIATCATTLSLSSRKLLAGCAHD